MESIHKYNALVIDDEKQMVDMLHDFLEKVNIKVTGVKDGVNALQILKKQKFDLILLDLNLPLMNGEHVMSILKGRNESTPVIVVSAFLTHERILELSKLGVKEFLAKPFDMGSLYDTVNKVCPIEYEKK